MNSRQERNKAQNIGRNRDRPLAHPTPKSPSQKSTEAALQEFLQAGLDHVVAADAAAGREVIDDFGQQIGEAVRDGGAERVRDLVAIHG